MSAPVSPHVVPRSPAPLRLPLIGSPYQRVADTPRRRWWNPLVVWVIAVTVGAALVFVPPLVAALVTLAVGGDVNDLQDTNNVGTMLLLNLVLASLVGVALLAVRVGHPIRTGFLHSVEGRVRWAWLGRCALVLLPLWVVIVLTSWVAGGAPNRGLADNWVPMLAMAVFLTPWQAAGEEYLFRGVVMQSVGSLTRSPRAGLILCAVVSAALFSAAHLSPDPWIIADLCGMALACVYLTWRTGGLEAAVALHAVNNVVILVVGTLTGTAADSFIDADAQGSAVQALTGIGMTALGTALIVWQARRVGITRTVPASVGAHP